MVAKWPAPGPLPSLSVSMTCPITLLTAMSTGPNRSAALRATRTTSSSRVMSPAMPRTSVPVSASIAFAVCSMSSACREVMTTRHPSAASARAVAAPMPRLPPETIATRPCSPRSMPAPQNTGDARPPSMLIVTPVR
jgi:hypothetical protein